MSFLQNDFSDSGELPRGPGAFRDERGRYIKVDGAYRELVGKADRRFDRHDAALGVGGAGSAAFLGRYQIERAWNKGVNDYFDKMDHRLKMATGIHSNGVLYFHEPNKQPRTHPATYRQGTDRRGRPVTYKVKSKGPRMESRYDQGKKRLTAAKMSNNAKRAKLTVRYGPRWMPGAAAGAAALGVYGARGQFSKSFSRRDYDNAVLGGAATVGTYHGTSYSLKPLDRRNEAKIKASDELALRAKRYRAESGLPRGAKAGDKRWVAYFRDYPADLPGARMKRTLAFTHAGGSGLAIAGGLGATGAYGAYKYGRRKNVKKSYLPGTGWVPATKAGVGALRSAPGGQQ